jgi:hypothetical protein
MSPAFPAPVPQDGNWSWDGSNWVCDPDCSAPAPCPPFGPPVFSGPVNQPPWYPGANGGVSFGAVAPPNPVRGHLWWDGTTFWLFDGAGWVNTAAGAALMGVTNGSDAAPGIVGEYIEAEPTFSISGAAAAVNTVPAAVLAPGDWDCQASILPSAGLKGLAFYIAQPRAVGVSNDMNGLASDFSAIAVDTSFIVLNGMSARALISVPTQFTFTVTSNFLAAGAATTAVLVFQARRRR